MTLPVYRGFGPSKWFFEAWGGVFRNESVPSSLWSLFRGPLASADEAYRGVTADGRVVEGLYPLLDTGFSTRVIMDAARAFIDVMQPGRRDVRFPVDAKEWRLWHNAFMPWYPTGLLLQTASAEERVAVMGIVEASHSARGYRDVRVLMTMNGLLGKLVGDEGRNLTEWMYWFRLFGEPSLTEPWGWQLYGHHLSLNCLIIGGQMVLTPSFMGAEPSISDETSGEFAGLRLFDDEQAGGLEFVRSLSSGQQAKAILHPSMLSEDLPPEMLHPLDGRHRAGAGQDNLVLPYEGLAGEDMSPGQKEGLLSLMRLYAERLPQGHSDLLLALFQQHIGETHFCWIGRSDSETTPFYFRIHSPVALIELDHHSGIFLDNAEPERFHAHTLMRTPNGNDYGMDLLRQHRLRGHRQEPSASHSHDGHGPHSHGPGDHHHHDH